MAEIINNNSSMEYLTRIYINFPIFNCLKCQKPFANGKYPLNLHIISNWKRRILVSFLSNTFYLNLTTTTVSCSLGCLYPPTQDMARASKMLFLPLKQIHPARKKKIPSQNQFYQNEKRIDFTSQIVITGYPPYLVY